MATFTGTFVNLGHEQWTVTVVSANGSGSRSLTLASDPLNIEMDDNDDILTPVRLTTGYLRVKGYKEELYPTMGSQNTVLLTKNSGSTVGWRGYIQPFAYDINVVRHSSEVYDIPVECPLSALKHIDLPIGSLSDYPSFGTILYYIMQKQSSMWDFVYFPSIIEAQYVLSARCDIRALIEKDSDGQDRAKYSCLEFIEAFCRMFGYCCRYDGHGGMTFLRLFRMEGGFCYLPKSYLTQSWISDSNFYTGSLSSINEADFPYASTEQKIELIEGFSRVKVSADVAKQSTVLFEMPTNWLRDYLADGTNRRGTKSDGGTNYEEVICVRDYEGSFSHDGWNWTFGLPTKKDDFTLSDGARIILLSHSYSPSTSREFKPVIELGKGSNSGSGIFRLSSERSFGFADGMLVISGTTYTKYDHIKYTGGGTIYARLWIGGYYYNGTWTVSQGSFQMIIGNNYEVTPTESKNATGVIVSYISGVNSKYNYNGGYTAMINYWLGDPLPRMGKVTFEILGIEISKSNDYGNNSELCIEDLKIEFLPDGMSFLSYEEKDESYIYDNGSYFRNTKEISVDFASDKYRIPGENSLYTYDGQLLETVTYFYQGSSERLHPEYWTAKYAGRFGQRTHQILDIEVSAKNGWVDPLTMFASYVSDKIWYVISVDKDFANCTQRIRAIEL